MKGVTGKDKNGLSRRHFVQVGSLGALGLGMASCSGDNEDDDVIIVTPPELVSRRVAPAPAYYPQSVATGDPREDSMVFWTRLYDADAASADHSVKLIIGLDAELKVIAGELTLQALASRDCVVKAKVSQLTPGTFYYYQFQYTKGAQTLGSKLGRTRTAPSATSNVAARFAVISCQDYRDRYYNTLAELGRRSDVDFVVHLGDYIYETTVEVLAKDGRTVSFSHPEEAIHLGERLAARSLSNYRDLYKIYRSDEALQSVHEAHPMISIWDDHEFANDCWQANGTYTNGAMVEYDPDRRVNAERAYAEYMPIDFGLNGAGRLAEGNEGFYPNAQLYRDFHWGKNLHLVMTDTRSFRPDHHIPEDAFPGAIPVDQAVLTAVFASQGVPFEAVKASFAAYVNIDAPQLGPYKQVLTGVLTQSLINEGFAPTAAMVLAEQKIQGNIAVIVANPLIAAYNASNPPQPLPPLEEEGLERGLAYALLGKTSLFSLLGSRYFVPKQTFDLFTQIRYQLTAGASENIYGTSQQNWLLDTLAGSSSSWRVVANAVPMNSMVLDFRAYPVPDIFKNQFYIGVDSFDGFPNQRKSILSQINDANPNTVFIAGDLHASFVTQHDHGLVEFTVAAVSSATNGDFIQEIATQPPFNAIPGIETLVSNISALILSGHPTQDNGIPKLKYVNNDAHGYAIIEASATALTASYNHLPSGHVHENLYANPALGTLFQRLGFRVQNGVLTQTS